MELSIKKIIPNFHSETEQTSCPSLIIQSTKEEDTESSCNKIIHSRRQHDELQYGFHQSYENEKESHSHYGALLSYDLEAFIASPCQINGCRSGEK